MSSDNQPLYVVDEKNEPIAVMDMEQIHRQGLMHRGVYLLLRIQRDRLVLRKRDADEAVYPGRWDIVGSGHVPAEFSSQEIAEHFIPAQLQTAELPLVRLSSLTPEAGTDNEFIEIFQIRVPPREARHIEEDLHFMSVDRDELQSLLRNYPGLLTPALATIWTAGIAFGAS